LAVAAYLFLVQAAFEFTIDDTFISMRYADHLARYGEIVWNPGEAAKVEGYSNLLWVFLLAGMFRFLPWDAFLMAKLLSVVFGAATLVVFSILACRILRNRALVAFSVLVIAVSRPFVVWGCSGMENMLYMFLMVMALWLLIKEDDCHKLSFATPVVLFLLCLTRTEGVVYFAAVFLIRLLRVVTIRDYRQAMFIKRWIVYNAIYSLLFVAWMAWKLWYYGTIIPLPVHLKTADGASGVLYIRDFLVSEALYVPLLIAGLCLTDYRKPFAYVAGFLTLLFAALSVCNPVMGHEYRLILAALPLMVLLALSALQQLLDGRSRWRQVLVLAVTGLFLLHWEVGFPQLYRGRLHGLGRNYIRFLEDVHIPIGKWLAAERQQGRVLSVALFDAGATAFYATDCHVIDYFGLNDREFSRVAMTPARLLARQPDYIILRSASADRFENLNDNSVGSMSAMIYDDPEFQRTYRAERSWSCGKKQYMFWIYRRIEDLKMIRNL
jgi:hypothetical protein